MCSARCAEAPLCATTSVPPEAAAGTGITICESGDDKVTADRRIGVCEVVIEVQPTGSTARATFTP
ncbi:hypothetical protein GCM10012275_53720 [Longimycelium tulufanense]|uniref:Uncharacterized protein n=1 Tax=Longimycelium tulufanense TaxID=907463 RepID=A0A8J3CD72_9PSEU|nr:hypothetical protein GCM10012275_53720 [Longimycelium tulufanense]